MDQTRRSANVAVLLKLQLAEGTPAVPDPTADALPVEADSISWNSPYTQEQSNEATGSLVTGAPLVVGQAATFSFKSRIKGAGSGAVYSATVKPPLHQALQACGKRGQFTPAIVGAAATAGGANSLTLPAAFSAVSRAVLGMILAITGGTGAGATPAVVEYTAGRVATLAETFNPVLDNTSVVSLPANWTYSSTSPSDATARAADQPPATVYIYQDGVLLKFTDARGTVNLDGQNARPGYATFNFSGIYQGTVDAPVPTNLVIANHSAPVLVQGTAISSAVVMKGRPLAISTWSLDAGSTLETPDDPNTPFGFGAGQITDRTPVLKVDPLATLIANRDTISDIGAGNTTSTVFRHGSAAGNRWALITPLAQPTGADPATRGKLASENISLQCRSLGRDAVTRDTDSILCFY